MSTVVKTNQPSKEEQDRMEAQWLDMIAEGDKQAFEKLYHAYQPRLLRFCHRIIGDLNGLEEIVNEVMYVVWQKAKTYNGTCRPSSWVFGIAYNKSLHSMRKNKKNSLQVGLDEINAGLAHHSDPTSQQENNDWLTVAFAMLSSEQRTVLELTYYYGMSYQEIGDVMGCSENTVKTRMFYARKKLQKILPGLAGQPTGEQP